MLTSDAEIIRTIALSTTLILLLVVIVIIAILKYRSKQKELQERENAIKVELVMAMLEAKEQTLEDISEKIHIDVQQTLSLAKLNLSQALLEPIDKNIDKIKHSKELITQTIADIKALSRDLDPKYITGHTLEENIEQQLDRVSKKTDLVTVFNTSEREISLPSEKQIFIYRIVQEAINNILAHAGATTIKISLVSGPTYFLLEIEDDGKGFAWPMEKDSKVGHPLGIGIVNMQHRTELINGIFSIETKPGKGTKIILKIPNET